jgi:hypothetical protein
MKTIKVKDIEKKSMKTKNLKKRAFKSRELETVKHINEEKTTYFHAVHCPKLLEWAPHSQNLEEVALFYGQILTSFSRCERLLKQDN